MKRSVVIVGLLLIIVLVLTGCAAGQNELQGTSASEVAHVAGFWLGLWHGVIAPITFVISLFNSHVGVYEVHNNGGWYNFGFLLGLTAVWGGGSHGARSAKSSR